MSEREKVLDIINFYQRSVNRHIAAGNDHAAHITQMALDNFVWLYEYVFGALQQVNGMWQ